MKKAVLAGCLCAVMFVLLAGCSRAAEESTAAETESCRESEDAPESSREETESVPEEPESTLAYRERNGDSWFSEEELRRGGNLAEQYYTDQGETLICVSFDQEDSPFLEVYAVYNVEYGEGNVLVLDIQLKGEEGPRALVLVRNGPETDWEIKEERF